jgi:hypothetical protein
MNVSVIVINKIDINEKRIVLTNYRVKKYEEEDK